MSVDHDEFGEHPQKTGKKLKTVQGAAQGPAPHRRCQQTGPFVLALAWQGVLPDCTLSIGGREEATESPEYILPSKH